MSHGADLDAAFWASLFPSAVHTEPTINIYDSSVCTTGRQIGIGEVNLQGVDSLCESLPLKPVKSRLFICGQTVEACELSSDHGSMWPRLQGGRLCPGQAAPHPISPAYVKLMKVTRAGCWSEQRPVVRSFLCKRV